MVQMLAIATGIDRCPVALFLAFLNHLLEILHRFPGLHVIGQHRLLRTGIAQAGIGTAIRFLAIEGAAVQPQFHLVAVGIHYHLGRRWTRCPVVGNEDRRQFLQSLALVEVVREFRQPQIAEHAAGADRGAAAAAAEVVDPDPDRVADMPVPAVVDVVGPLVRPGLAQLQLFGTVGAAADGDAGVDAGVIVAVFADERAFAAFKARRRRPVVAIAWPAAVGDIVVADIAAAIAVAGGEELAAGIFLAGDPAAFGMEGILAIGLVQADLPHDGAGMVAVPANHLADVLPGQIGKLGIVVPPLPARGADGNHQAKLVAGIHHRFRLRIVGKPEEVEPCLLQPLQVAVLGIVGNRIAQPGEILVPVGTADH